jgi:hypothetical protein
MNSLFRLSAKEAYTKAVFSDPIDQLIEGMLDSTYQKVFKASREGLFEYQMTHSIDKVPYVEFVQSKLKEEGYVVTEAQMSEGIVAYLISWRCPEMVELSIVEGA